MTLVLDGPCSPWIGPAEARELGDFPEGMDDAGVTLWLTIATDLLYRLSGRQYPGLCESTARPEGCSWEVRLPMGPVRAVLSVLEDGVALVEGTDYRVDDVDRSLVHRLDRRWPVQRHSLPLTEPGTFGVTYRWGSVPSASGLRAVSEYAAELAKADAGGECRLPERVTSLVRENVSMAVLDPFDFLDHGRTGLLVVDTWLKAVNPNGVERSGGAIDPLLSARPRRHCC